jgi:hypothetical protein
MMKNIPDTAEDALNNNITTNKLTGREYLG